MSKLIHPAPHLEHHSAATRSPTPPARAKAGWVRLGEQGMVLTKAEQAGRAEMAATAVQSSSPSPARLLPLGFVQENLLLYSRNQHNAPHPAPAFLQKRSARSPSVHLPLLANKGSEQFHRAQEALVQHKHCSDFPPTP